MSSHKKAHYEKLWVNERFIENMSKTWVFSRVYYYFQNSHRFTLPSLYLKKSKIRISMLARIHQRMQEDGKMPVLTIGEDNLVP